MKSIRFFSLVTFVALLAATPISASAFEKQKKPKPASAKKAPAKPAPLKKAKPVAPKAQPVKARR